MTKAAYLAEGCTGAAGVATRESSSVCSQVIACSQAMQQSTAPRIGVKKVSSWCKRCSIIDTAFCEILMQKVEKDGARTLGRCAPCESVSKLFRSIQLVWRTNWILGPFSGRLYTITKRRSLSTQRRRYS